MNRRKSLKVVTVLLSTILVLLFGFSTSVSAETYELNLRTIIVDGVDTGPTSGSLPDDGAIWQKFPSYVSTGTGNYHSFLRVQNNGTEKGFNTNGTPELDTKGGVWTHAIQLSYIPRVTIGSTTYYEICFDINETTKVDPNTESLISLDSFQLWLTNVDGASPHSYHYDYATKTFYTDDAGDTISKVYDIDDTDRDGIIEDTTITLDYRVANGSGWGDYRVLVPVSYFTGYDPNSYLVVFTEHGLNWPSDDGFEEWAVIPRKDTQISTMLSVGNTGETPVPVGDSITDTITLDWQRQLNNKNQENSPTGVVRIYYQEPGSTTWLLHQTYTLPSGISPPYSFDTDPITLTKLGSYYFKAVFDSSSSDFYDSESGATEEMATVTKRSTNIYTTLSSGNAGTTPQLIGTKITDKITLSWTAPAGYVPTGKIVVKYMEPGATTWTLLEEKALSGLTTSPYEFTTAQFELSKLGEYKFKAYYVPDADAVFNASESGDDAEKANVFTRLRITKTVNNLPFSGPPIQFQIRQGAAPVTDQFGTVIESAEANIGNNGMIDFTTNLSIGTYQLCEYVPLGYVPSYIWGTYGVDWFKPGYEPNGGSPTDNAWVAVNFTVNSDGSITFQNQTANPPTGRVIIDNQVGEIPRTIGFWKNYCSASTNNGGQEHVLDWMLYDADQAGYPITIGDLVLYSGNTRDDAGINALYAVRLLNKSTIDKGKKMASDPTFNLAAQLLAYRLNQVNSAMPNSVAMQAANIAQEILDGVNFNGINWNKPSNKTELAQLTKNLNYLAWVLDSYNNDTLVLGSLVMPYPGVGYTP